MLSTGFIIFSVWHGRGTGICGRRIIEAGGSSSADSACSASCARSVSSVRVQNVM